MKKNILTLLLFVALLGSLTKTTHAQTFNETPVTLNQPLQEKRSPGTAGLIVLGSYIGGWTALVQGAKMSNSSLAFVGTGGIFLAPALGYGYAGEVGKGLGLSLLSVLGATVFISTIDICIFECEQQDDKSGIAALGLALHFGSTILALIDAPNAAKRTNRRRQHVMVAPTMIGKNIGLGIAGSF